MAGQTRPLAIGRCRRVLASALPGGQGRPRLPVACTLCVLVRARACSCPCVLVPVCVRVCVRVRVRAAESEALSGPGGQSEELSAARRGVGKF